MTKKEVANKVQKALLKAEEPKQATFSKSDILKSDEFTNINKDFLFAYLDETKQYTIEQAKEILNKKLRGVIE